MVASRTYLTGGLGSRHRDEAFGDPFELPPDRADAETCAAIGSVMLAWRLPLATGESRFADMIERTALNAVLAGTPTSPERNDRHPPWSRWYPYMQKTVRSPSSWISRRV